MNKIFLVILSVVLSGCYMTRHYTGIVPEGNYEIQFLSESEAPISGIRVDCREVEEGKTFSSTSTTSFFNKSTESNEQGILILNQRSHKTAGSYNYIGSYQWGHTKSRNTICNFYQRDSLVYTSEIKSFSSSVKNVVHVKSI
jgi:hypothetical protein